MDLRLRKMPYKVDLTLAPEDRAAYLDYLADARTTLVKAITWLKTRGYKLSWGAVYRHRKYFKAEQQEMRRWEAATANLKELAQIGQGAAFTDGTLTVFERALFEILLKLDLNERLPARTLAEFGQAVQSAVIARGKVEEQRRLRESEERKAARRAARVKKRKAGRKRVVLRIGKAA